MYLLKCQTRFKIAAVAAITLLTSLEAHAALMMLSKCAKQLVATVAQSLLLRLNR